MVKKFGVFFASQCSLLGSSCFGYLAIVVKSAEKQPTPFCKLSSGDAGAN